jgi:hypothetical protein
VDVLREVDEADGVGALVVLPRADLDEVGVERDARARVKHRRLRRLVEVGRDDLVLRLADDALERALRRGLLEDRLDLLLGRGALEARREVDDGDVDRTDAEGAARQLAVLREARGAAGEREREREREPRGA